MVTTGFKGLGGGLDCRKEVAVAGADVGSVPVDADAGAGGKKDVGFVTDVDAGGEVIGWREVVLCAGIESSVEEVRRVEMDEHGLKDLRALNLPGVVAFGGCMSC